MGSWCTTNNPIPTHTHTPRAVGVGVVTASFNNEGEEGGEDRERQVVGVHHLHALISLGESAIMPVFTCRPQQH